MRTTSYNETTIYERKEMFAPELAQDMEQHDVIQFVSAIRQ